MRRTGATCVSPLTPFEHVPLTALTPTVVRRWHSDALRGPGGNTSIGQAYRLVRAVMNTALREGIIARNPARFPGRGVPDKTPNCRNTAASGGTGRGDTWSLKAAVLLAAWGGLRRGEILALRREDVDLKAGVVSVNRNQVEMLEGRRRFDSRPKTDAGLPDGGAPAPRIADPEGTLGEVRRAGPALRVHLRLPDGG